MVSVAVFALWIVAEFYGERLLRIALGSLLIVGFSLMCVVIGVSTKINDQVHYGNAAKRLLGAIRGQLVFGDRDSARKAIISLDESFQPSYEGYLFPVYVDRALAKMNAELLKSKSRDK